MDKKLIVPITLFTLTNPIFLSEGPNENNTTTMVGTTTPEELPIKIIELAKNYNINDIILYGEEDFLNPIKEDILTYSVSQYKNNKLNVSIEKGV